jgi:predicted DCC family thiol-disulfide oxidoreductase YuxK
MKVIFFDGICGLCNHFVDFMLKVDRKGLYRFSPLQSDFARSQLPPAMTENLKTLVLLDEGRIFTKSEAVIRILTYIGGPWKMVYVGRLLPKFILDKAYDLISENRYRLFGRKDTCRIPTEEERNRFVI